MNCFWRPSRSCAALCPRLSIVHPETMQLFGSGKLDLNAFVTVGGVTPSCGTGHCVCSAGVPISLACWLNPTVPSLLLFLLFFVFWFVAVFCIRVDALCVTTSSPGGADCLLRRPARCVAGARSPGASSSCRHSGAVFSQRRRAPLTGRERRSAAAALTNRVQPHPTGTNHPATLSLGRPVNKRGHTGRPLGEDHRVPSAAAPGGW